jgi:putative addiction module component (TIGR02574 family)
MTSSPSIGCGKLELHRRQEFPMTTPIHELEAQLLSLGSAERARLLESLIQSFEPDTKAEQAWVAEALRREAEVKAGLSKMVPGPQALERVRARLG